MTTSKLPSARGVYEVLVGGAFSRSGMGGSVGGWVLLGPVDMCPNSIWLIQYSVSSSGGSRGWVPGSGEDGWLGEGVREMG